MNFKVTFDKLFRRKTAYQACFYDRAGNLTIHGQLVIQDLQKFCRVYSSTACVNHLKGNIDPIAMAIAEGRREVFNRIQHYLQLSDSELLKAKELNDE